MKKYTPLAIKLTSFSTTIILLTSVCVALIVYLSADSFFSAAAIKNIKNEAKLIANDIENSVIKINNDISVLIKTPPIQGIVRSTNNNGIDEQSNSTLAAWKDRLATIFTSMLQANRYYTQIRYLGVSDNGKEIVRVNQNDQGIYTVDDAALQSKGDTDYFKTASKLTEGSILLSDINYNQEKGKIQFPLVPTLRVSTPVYEKNHHVFGMLVININIARYLRSILLRSASYYDVILYNQNDDFFIFNHETKSLDFFPRDKKINRALFGTTSISSTKQIIPFLKKDENRVTIFQPVFSNVNKDQQIFTVAISIPRKLLEKNDSALITNMLSWIFGLCILSSIIIFIYTKRLMSPLSQMARKIKESGGYTDDELQLPVHLKDEVGLLAQAFEEKTRLLGKLALFDSLTGLPNRKNFIDHFEDAIQNAKSEGTLFAILYLDLNGFKEINDTYGHDHGDKLLIEFANNVKNTLRKDDFCARLGGDEFAILIKDIQSKDQIIKAIKPYQDALNSTYSIKGVTTNITISGGIAIYPNDSTMLDELMKYADEAMYVSKKAGDGKIHITHTNKHSHSD